DIGRDGELIVVRTTECDNVGIGRVDVEPLDAGKGNRSKTHFGQHLVLEVNADVAAGSRVIQHIAGGIRVAALDADGQVAELGVGGHVEGDVEGVVAFQAAEDDLIDLAGDRAEGDFRAAVDRDGREGQESGLGQQGDDVVG